MKDIAYLILRYEDELKKEMGSLLSEDTKEWLRPQLVRLYVMRDNFDSIWAD